MKVARSNALAAHRPEERIESMVEEICQRLDAISWGPEIPVEVARELSKINDTLNWRCLHVLEQRLARMESAMERIERKLP